VGEVVLGVVGVVEEAVVVEVAVVVVVVVVEVDREVCKEDVCLSVLIVVVMGTMLGIVRIIVEVVVQEEVAKVVVARGARVAHSRVALHVVVWGTMPVTVVLVGRARDREDPRLGPDGARGRGAT
jgi:hypothetical protein